MVDILRCLSNKFQSLQLMLILLTLISILQDNCLVKLKSGSFMGYVIKLIRTIS